MPQPTTYTSQLVFGAKVDSSLDRSSKEVEARLAKIGQESKVFADNISTIGKQIVGLGTAFLGLRTGTDFFRDAIDKGQQLVDVFSSLQANIGKMYDLSGNRKNDLLNALNSFNAQLGKMSIYSSEIAQNFEAMLTAQGFKNVSQIETLTRNFELLAAQQRRRLTPEDARKAAADLATAVKTGGATGFQALRDLGLSLTPADYNRFVSIQQHPGFPLGATYDARERFIEEMLQRQARPGAFEEARRDPRMASYLLQTNLTKLTDDIGLEIHQRILDPLEQWVNKQIEQHPDIAKDILVGLGLGGLGIGGGLGAKILGNILFGGGGGKGGVAGAAAGIMNVRAGVVNIYGGGGGGGLAGAPETAPKTPLLPIVGSVAGSAAGTVAGVGAGFGAMWLGGFLGSKIAERYHVVPYDPKNDRWSKIWERGGEAPLMQAPSLGTPGGGPSKEQQRSANELAKALGLPGYQGGALVTRPHLALVGEGGPELIAPLDALGERGKTAEATDKNTREIKGLTEAVSELTDSLKDSLREQEMANIGGIPTADTGGHFDTTGRWRPHRRARGRTSHIPVKVKPGEPVGEYPYGYWGGVSPVTVDTSEAARAAVPHEGTMYGLSRRDIPKVYGSASIRYNNPGAAWPGPESKKYGADFYGYLGLYQGEKEYIAHYPDVEHGLASNIARWGSKTYLGKTLGGYGQGIWTWSGHHGSEWIDYQKHVAQRLGVPLDTVITKGFLKQHGAELIRAQAEFETAGGARKVDPWLTDARVQGGQEIYNRLNPDNNALGGFIAGKTLSWLAEKGSEFVIPTRKTGRSLGLLNRAAGALGETVGGGHTVHFNPNITINAAGHDLGSLQQLIVQVLREQPQHLLRILQEAYRDHQRAAFA